MTTPEPSPLTRGLTTGLNRDQAARAVVPPLHLSTNYAFAGLDAKPDFDYTRSGNPTRALLQEALATLEGGAGAVCTASGMAALTLVVQSFVPVGGRVVATHDCYGGTWRLLTRLATTGRLVVDFVDLTDPDEVAELGSRPADLMLVESPSNPLLRVTDLAAVAANRPSGALVAVDNTFCSPVRQHPLALGADLVVHSTTKFINGHSDVLGGAVVAADATHAGLLGEWCNTLGLPASPTDAWLTLRGLRTLSARMRVHEENALRVVDLLAKHPAVSAVHHPSLASHPGHEVAARQQSGFGSLLSFELAGGRPAVDAFVAGLGVFILAESLGGTESLVAHPATMTHAAMPPEVQAAAGITPGLVRLSVGLEAADDLVADLAAGLERAARV